MRFSLRHIVVGAAVVASAMTGALGLKETAVADISHAPAQAEPPTEDNGGSIVEDGSYPDAAAIEGAQHIKLISGDGHILFADCATPPVNDIGVLKVRTTEQIGPGDAGLACFKIT